MEGKKRSVRNSNEESLVVDETRGFLVGNLLIECLARSSLFGSFDKMEKFSLSTYEDNE